MAKRPADLRGRVKAARAIAAMPPGMIETLQRDRRGAARFDAEFGVPADVREDLQDRTSITLSEAGPMR